MAILQSRNGFALPTVLISSIVMLMILVTTISVTSSIHSAIRDQNYTKLATLAAEAGTVMASACLNQSGGQATWSNIKPLKPNTDCKGNPISGVSEYVLEKEDVRTYFVVQQPLLGAGNVPISSSVKGYSEVLRASSGTAWRVWSSDTSVALASGGDFTPVGTYIDGAWTTAPSGYLLADGSAVSRTTYANLFSVIGTTYGSGNGSTTFNLPDTRGRVSVNKSSDSEFNTLGEKYGSKTHTLTIAEMPSHTHAQNPHSHSMTGGWGAGPRNQSRFRTDSNSPANLWASVGSTTATNKNTGGGGAHNNIQPSIVVNRAIKY